MCFVAIFVGRDGRSHFAELHSLAVDRPDLKPQAKISLKVSTHWRNPSSKLPFPG
jgi:hypothetical protein